MANADKKPSFSPTVRDALMIYRMLQLGYCTREQIQRHIFGEGASAKVSMSRRWSLMKKLGYIKEKDRLFYATALGVQEVLMRVLAEQPEELAMVDQDRLPRPPNPGNANLLHQHHKWTAETVLFFIERYEGLPLVKHLYVLRAQKLWGGRIEPDSTILLIYNKAFSLFFLEVEIDNTREDFKRKLKQYARYDSSGAFQRDYEDQFQAQYDLPELNDLVLRVMIFCANERRKQEMVRIALSLGEEDESNKTDLFRFTTFDEILHRDEPKPIWVSPSDRITGKFQKQKRWEVE